MKNYEDGLKEGKKMAYKKAFRFMDRILANDAAQVKKLSKEIKAEIKKLAEGE